MLNSLMTITRAGGAVGIPGLYVTGDPGAGAEEAKEGSLSIRIGLGWAKSHTLTTGQCPVMKYNRELMMAILNDRCQIAKAVNAKVITLDEAPKGYKDFDKRRGQEVRPRPARADQGLSGPPRHCAALISRRSSSTRSTTPRAAGRGGYRPRVAHRVGELHRVDELAVLGA